MKRALIAFVCLLVVILASACGGGGGGGTTTTNGGVNGGNGGNNGGNGGNTTSTLSQFLYVGNRGANPDGTITVFEMFAGGALTKVGTPEITPITPTGLAVSGNGQYLYVSRITPTQISQFQIEPGGFLTPLAVPEVGMGGAAWSIVAHPTKNTVYVPDSTNNRIYQFAIGAGGQLQPLSPTFLVTSSDPRYLAIHPSGDVLYVVCRDGATVDQFNVTGDGSLAPHATPTVAAGLGASSITLTNNGLYGYVACELAMNIHQFKINVATKSLEPNGVFNSSITNLSGMIYNDQYYYTSDYDGTANGGGNFVYQFSINPNGTLTPLSPSSRASGEGPMPIFVAPGTNFAYIANQSDGTIWHYTIGATGQLTFVKSYTTDQPGSTPASFAHVDQTP